MHLLAREETGLRCLLRVALEGRSGSPVSIARIAECEAISNVYTAKLMRQLRMAKLVESTRGAAGGYRLTRPAQEITVWDAIHALDESFLPATTCDCQGPDRVDCRRTTDCAVSSLWRRLGAEIRQQLSDITLEELCSGSLKRPDHTKLPLTGDARSRCESANRRTPDGGGADERKLTWPSSI
ncbi:MAG: Rrf2 family transcriptional regulator [Proteobacteria bacterium]|nr:Rrf2 family transcriptional regulator [Pseudomonadota bacterium]